MIQDQAEYEHAKAESVKAGIIVDHFNEFVIAPRKIADEARTMPMLKDDLQ